MKQNLIYQVIRSISLIFIYYFIVIYYFLTYDHFMHIIYILYLNICYFDDFLY